MYRVELKGGKIARIKEGKGKFLMHRVELKAFQVFNTGLCYSTVPNVPCGVERKLKRPKREGGKGFLMYRVELKESYSQSQHQH